MRYAYIACPIDRAFGGSPLVAALDTYIIQRKIPHYSPRHAWRNLEFGDFGAVLQAANNVALGGSTVVLAVIPENQYTLGVPMEIQHAMDRKVPVVLLTDKQPGTSGAIASIDGYVTADPLAAVLECQRLLARTFGEATRPSPMPSLDLDALDAAFAARPRPKPTENLVGRWVDHGGGAAPRPGKAGDAGYDLTASMSYDIEPGETAAIPCQISVQLPDGYWGLIQGRSSSWRRKISVKASIMDAGYRGEFWIDCLNIGPDPVKVMVGERIAQLIPMPSVPPIAWVEVHKLDASERGDTGYGSTGK